MNESPITAEFKEILDTMLSKEVSRDGYRISLWSNFFNEPTYAVIERNHGLLRDEFNTLFCLANYGPITARNICLVMGRPKNSVSRAIERLSRKGMISRRADPNDRRKTVLTLNSKGRAAYEKTNSLFLEREALMLRSLNKADRRALSRILGKLMNAYPDWCEVIDGNKFSGRGGIGRHGVRQGHSPGKRTQRQGEEPAAAGA
jgi:DNA-binding MarR family transcriptional regulator